MMLKFMTGVEKETPVSLKETVRPSKHWRI